MIGIIYGALAALAQTDIKRLVAYSSVSHMGFIVLGIFAFNATGLDGSAIQMVNHGLTTGALFACVGMIYERYHTRDMTQLGGLWNRLPILAFFLILAALGSAAVPGLNGFVGEFPILAGTFQTSARAAVLAATGMILGACYLLWMLRTVVFGPLREPAHEAADRRDRRRLTHSGPRRGRADRLARDRRHDSAPGLDRGDRRLPAAVLESDSPGRRPHRPERASPACRGRAVTGKARSRADVRASARRGRRRGGATKKGGGQPKPKAKAKGRSSSAQERRRASRENSQTIIPAHPSPDANRDREEKRP